MRTKTKNTKRNIICAVLLVILALFCGYKIILNIKEKNEYKAQLAMATENAVRYVRGKYGFEPEFIEEVENRYDREKLGIMHLIFQYNSKKFMVISDCLKDNTVCFDNYQYEEVMQAVTDKILSEYPNGKAVSVIVGNNNTPLFQAYGSYVSFRGFETYYDGSNLDEILTNCRGKVEMVFADTVFSDMDILDWLTKRNIDVEFTSFDTEERLEQFGPNPSSWFSSYYRYKMLAPYITDHLEIKDGEKQGLNISFQSCGDFIYSYFPISEKGFPVSSEATAEERHPEAVAQHYKRYDEGEYVSKPITNAYVFNRGYDIYIYYPLEKLQDYDIENIGVAWYSDGGQVNNRNIEKLSVWGDYAVFYLPVGADTFMLVDTSGYDEYIPGWAKIR